MILFLERETYSLHSTIGALSIVGEEENWVTLELPKNNGMPGAAIPSGLFSIELLPSPKFQELAKTDPWFLPYASAMPHLLKIPNRSEIMLHPGNSPLQTDGCILVGSAAGIDYIYGSREAFATIYARLTAALAQTEPLSILIQG